MIASPLQLSHVSCVLPGLLGLQQVCPSSTLSLARNWPGSGGKMNSWQPRYVRAFGFGTDADRGDNVNSVGIDFDIGLDVNIDSVCLWSWD